MLTAKFKPLRKLASSLIFAAHVHHARLHLKSAPVQRRGAQPEGGRCGQAGRGRLQPTEWRTPSSGEEQRRWRLGAAARASAPEPQVRSRAVDGMKERGEAMDSAGS
eukprot:scaffold680_cov264-Pinguiococcus_pyrenoidosus.AAC.19